VCQAANGEQADQDNGCEGKNEEKGCDLAGGWDAGTIAARTASNSQDETDRDDKLNDAEMFGGEFPA
jgi:hypothetical protein